MYLIKKFDQVTKRIEVLEEISDPSKAYELAHELCAMCNFGRDEEDMDKSKNKCIIIIEDENGNDMWEECAAARCPSVSNSLFQ